MKALTLHLAQNGKLGNYARQKGLALMKEVFLGTY
jgi:hypothetical protein